MLHLLMTGRVRVTPKMIALHRVADRAAQREKWSGKVDEKVLEQVVKRIVEAVAPEKIIVFGSAARGEMGPDSDLDLLIVKSGVHRLATAQMIEHSLIGITIPTDIVVATPKDIEAHKNTIGLIYRPALQEGKILYAA
jgi:predicted nucleotidyltransferase